MSKKASNTAGKPIQPIEKVDKTQNKGLSNNVWIAILIGLCFLLYYKSLSFEFTSCDDTDLIVDNYPFIKSTKNIGKAFKQSCFEIPGHLTDDKAYYRPTLISSFIIDAQFQRPTPDGYPKSKMFHFTNILLHIGVVLLLFKFLRLMGANGLVSAILAGIFAVHPLNVMAVSWIPGRNDSILGIFVLLSIYSLIAYYIHKKNIWIYLHLISFCAAMFTKESGVVLLPLFYLLIWAKGFDLKAHLKNPIIILGYIGAIGLWAFARKKALEGDVYQESVSEMMDTFVKNLTYFPMHIGKYFFPLKLSVMPGVTTLNLILGVIGCLLMLFIFMEDPKQKNGFLWIDMDRDFPCTNTISTCSSGL